MPQSLLAFDTDHIKRYVFGTNKLKEIRGASSLLDWLNRVETRKMAESAEYGAETIFAHGGSALFLLDLDQAERLGKAVQKLYHETTSGGASITYAIQPIPEAGGQDLLHAQQLIGGVTMTQVLQLLRSRLKLAKDTLNMSHLPQEGVAQARELANEQILALPSHALFSPCNSCGIAYAEMTRHDIDDPEEAEGRYCRMCAQKRDEDAKVKNRLRNSRRVPLSSDTLWGRILQTLVQAGYPDNKPYILPDSLKRPEDFHVFREFTGAKEYLGLVYADANGMGKVMDAAKSLAEAHELAEFIDTAVFLALGDAIRSHLPARNELLPFDILLVGGDDIVLVTSAAQALEVAATLAERFHVHTNGRFSLSVGVVLAPIKYPFGLQHALVDEALKAAKKAGAEKKMSLLGEPEPAHVNFVIVTGSTSLSYAKIYEKMHSKRPGQEEFYATMRPYALPRFQWLLAQLRLGNEQRLGRTKLHQLREAILKIDRSKAATILEALALLRNWKEQERTFVKDLVKSWDIRLTPLQEQKGTIFPWGLDGQRSTDAHLIYTTPLLDFIELYDFVP